MKTKTIYQHPETLVFEMKTESGFMVDSPVTDAVGFKGFKAEENWFN